VVGEYPALHLQCLARIPDGRWDVPRSLKVPGARQPADWSVNVRAPRS